MGNVFEYMLPPKSRTTLFLQVGKPRESGSIPRLGFLADEVMLAGALISSIKTPCGGSELDHKT